VTRTRPVFPSRYVNLEAARRAFGDRVDRLGAFLTRVDDAGDAAVEAIEALPRGEGWRAFERAITSGDPAALAAAPPAIRALVEEAADVPVWVDWDTCDRGGALLMRAGVLGGAVLGSRSLVLGYASPAGNKPLVLSGRLAEQAARRLNETARFVQAVCRPGGMRPFADGWQITLKVRLIHAQVRRMILRGDRWDASAWGAPINQHDMAGTVLLFSVSIIDGLRKLGMSIDATEAERYVHLWRWVGDVIGVHPDVLPASEAEAMRLVSLIEATTGPPDQDSRDLTRALFDAGRLAAHTPRQQRLAARRAQFGAAILRELLGDTMADQLGVETTSFRYAMPLIRRMVEGVERVRRAVPLANVRAVAAGERYWDRVVQLGLQDATYDFALPERLRGRAA